MRALVTGGNGFLGRYIVAELHARDYDVIAPTSAAFDLRNPRDIESLFWSLGRVDVIVHAAARVGGIGANVAAPGDFFRDNVQMGVNLMDAALHAGVKKMLTIGTACMYPEWLGSPQREEHLWDGVPALATAPYAYAKRAILEMGMAYRKQYGFNAVMVVPTNLYGPEDNFDVETGHVIPSMIRKFSEATDRVTLWGTGYPTRDFLYVADAARGIADALEMYDGDLPVNLGSGRSISIAQIADIIAKRVGFVDGEIIWDKSKPDGTPYRQLSIEHAQQTLKWTPHVSLDDGIDATVEWFERNKVHA